MEGVEPSSLVYQTSALTIMLHPSGSRGDRTLKAVRPTSLAARLLTIRLASIVKRKVEESNPQVTLARFSRPLTHHRVLPSRDTVGSRTRDRRLCRPPLELSLIHISEPTRQAEISY